MNIDDLSAMHSKILSLREEQDCAKAELKRISDVVDAAESELLLAMETAKLKSIKTKYGTIVAGSRFSVRLPASPEDWTKFWDFAKRIGAYDTLRTVNSQKLNGWYKEELAAAVERGELEWHPDGLQPPTHQSILTLRKS